VSEHWRVSVDADRCIGSGICAATAPEYFRLDGPTSCPVAELVEAAEVVREVAESCPSEAIAVRDADTGEMVAPEF
jgi:ferredoxin